MAKQSTGHIRQRGKHSWQIKYDGAPDPVTGERRTVFETVKGSKTEAKARLSIAIGEVAGGTHVAPTSETVATYAKHWLENVAPVKASGKTLERYRELVDGHIVPSLGKHTLSKLTKEHVEAFYREKRESGRLDGKGGLAERTIIHIHRRLAAILDSAALSQKVRRNVAKIAETRPSPKKAKRKLAEGIDYLTDADAQKLLAALAGTRMHAPALLAFATGMRRGEILGLRWSDIDVDRPELHVAQAIEQTRDGITVREPKTESSRRTISLPAFAVEVLRAHRAQQAKERLALGLGKSSMDLVFTRYDGAIVNPRNFSKEFQRMAAAAGFPGFKFHGTRHTHATSLLRHGINVKVVSERLGHASIVVTLDIYGHVLREQTAEVANKLDTIFGDGA